MMAGRVEKDWTVDVAGSECKLVICPMACMPGMELIAGYWCCCCCC